MKKAIAAAVLGSLVMVSGQAMADNGEKTYKAVCFACHGTGVAGAPKLGDKADWAPRIAQGTDVLNTHAIKGYKGKKGVMLPKGGRADLADADVIAAVAYMVNASK